MPHRIKLRYFAPPTNHTWCTSYATKVKTWPQKDSQTWAFVRQSIGVLVWNRIFHNDLDKPNIPNSLEIAVQSNPTNVEAITIPETMRGRSQKFSPWQKDHVTELMRINIWSLKRIRVRNSLSLLLQTPVAQSMIYVIIQSQFTKTLADIDFLIHSTMAHGTHMYAFHKS